MKFFFSSIATAKPLGIGLSSESFEFGCILKKFKIWILLSVNNFWDYAPTEVESYLIHGKTLSFVGN